MQKKNIFFLISFIALCSAVMLFFGSSSIISSAGKLLDKELNEHFWKTGIERTAVELIFFSFLFLVFAFFYKKYPSQTFSAATMLCLVLFFVYILKDSMNIPFNDDYDYLKFLNGFSNVHDLKEIVKQDGNESKLIFMKFLSASLFYLHSFNIKLLILFADACLLGTYLLLYKSIHLDKLNKIFLGFILAILLFQFQYYDSSVWAAGALYSQCTIFFVFLSIYFISSEYKYKIIFSLLFATLAAINCGAGFLAFGIGLLVSLTRKKTIETILWLLVLFLICSFYFSEHFFPNAKYSFDFSELLTDFFKHSGRCFLFSCVFLGSSFQYYYQTVLPLAAGIFIWSLFIFVSLKKYYKKNLTNYLFLIFLICVSLLPAIFRKDYIMPDAIANRYGIYSAVALLSSIIALLENINYGKNIMIAIFSFSIIIHLTTNIFFYPEMIFRKEALIEMTKHYKLTGIVYMTPPYDKWTPSNSTMIVQEAAEKNIYKFPE